MSKKNSRGIQVDFTNIDEGGSRIPAGDYVVKVEKIEVRDGNSGFKYLAWTLSIVTGEYKGKKIYHNTSLKPEALFNLRNMLTAIGVEVPKGKFTLNLKSYVGKVLGVYVEDGEYTLDGKKRKKTEVIEMYPVEKQGKKWVKAIDDDEGYDDDEDYDDEDYDDDDDDEDYDDDEDDEDDDDDDDEDEDDEDLESELDDLLDDDDDDDEDDEDDDEEEEPAPRKKKSSAKKESSSKGKKKRMKL